MQIKVKDVNINYIQYGKEDSKDVILLHGWGQNIEMMKPIGDGLADRFRITILDLPGFGESEEPTYPWTVEDYALMIEEIVSNLKINKPIVMGHSFGGRVAITFASNNVIEKLVLFGSPIKQEKNSESLKVKTLKGLKKMPGMSGIAEKMKKYIGSRDYKAASTIMRQVLVNTVNKDLTEYAKKIEEPVLLIWGDNDEEASISNAHILEKVMLDAGLIILPGTHYAYLENIGQVISILNSFL